MSTDSPTMKRDYYETLGVQKGADPDALKKAFRKLAMECHPDRHPGDHTAEQRFKDVGEANSVLSDPEQRREYDAVRQMTRGGARFTAGGPGGSAGGFEDVFSSMFGGGGGTMDAALGAMQRRSIERERERDAERARQKAARATQES